MAFFTISFISLLVQLPPFEVERSELNIGFPFVYYSEFFVDNTLHHDWDVYNLLYDGIIVGLGTLFFYLLINKLRFKEKI